MTAPCTPYSRAPGRIDVTAGPPALSRWLFPLLAGALTAALTALLASGLVTFRGTGPWGDVIRVSGWLLFLLAPSTAVPAAILLAHRWLYSGLGVTGICVALLAGTAAAIVSLLSFAALS
ncbi:hypothetical protein AB0M02_17695 [Actinoplanes sp. NPDC051861]|uniref:hypothetical protein n=1 Tax=Actinoplanes sp. NPDC051861 TaxID=3155170 RepID=UPI0034155150